MTVSSNEKLSVVIPVYNSAESLPILMERLFATLSVMSREFEVICIDDRSLDNSWHILNGLKKHYGSPLKIALLRANSGQHNTILCGLYLAKGDIIITMDDDLQNPPEEIPKLVQIIDQGYDLAIGSYINKMHSGLRNAGGRLIDWMLRKIFKLPNDFQLTSFRAVRRSVIENVCRIGGIYPYITAMLLANSDNYINVPVRHDVRMFGHSNYTMEKSLVLAAKLVLCVFISHMNIQLTRTHHPYTISEFHEE